MLTVVPGKGKNWTDEQMRIVNEGIERTQGSVPSLDGQFDAFIVLDGETPVGLFSIMPTGKAGAVEVGVRFWDRRNTAARVMGRGLAQLFRHYEIVVARCYANNMSVRRLLQRAAFVLLGTERRDGRSVHIYACKRPDFFRVMPKEVIPDG